MVGFHGFIALDNPSGMPIEWNRPAPMPGPSCGDARRSLRFPADGDHNPDRAPAGRVARALALGSGSRFVVPSHPASRRGLLLGIAVLATSAAVPSRGAETVLAIGDSITVGRDDEPVPVDGVAPLEGWVGILARHLGPEGTAFVSCARGGKSSWWGRGVVDRCIRLRYPRSARSAPIRPMGRATIAAMGHDDAYDDLIASLGGFYRTWLIYLGLELGLRRRASAG